jgi:hypothetical protein
MCKTTVFLGRHSTGKYLFPVFSFRKCSTHQIEVKYYFTLETQSWSTRHRENVACHEKEAFRKVNECHFAWPVRNAIMMRIRITRNWNQGITWLTLENSRVNYREWTRETSDTTAAVSHSGPVIRHKRCVIHFLIIYILCLFIHVCLLKGRPRITETTD